MGQVTKVSLSLYLVLLWIAEACIFDTQEADPSWRKNSSCLVSNDDKLFQ